MHLLTSKKNLLIGGVIILVVGAVSYYFVMPKNSQNENVPKTNNVLNQGENVAPTVDASVKVELIATSEKRDIVLKIDGIPSGTSSIAYEATYEAKNKGLQGATGIISLDNNEKIYEKRIKDALATCSSGRCVYHEVVGKVKATLKFSGSYGDKIFEKEYEM